jgi:hypothetical protein
MGKTSCDVEHVGIVISGRATAAMNDGRVIEMKSGDIFYIAPGHDSWVIGAEPYVSLHLLGANDYAVTSPRRNSATACRRAPFSIRADTAPRTPA